MLFFLQKSGPLIYPLILISLLALILILERTFYFITLSISSKSHLLKKLNMLLESNQHLGKEKRDEVISYTLMVIRDRYEFGIQYLRIIAVLSPMIGLLGTVIGMIEAFRSISEETGSVSPSIIANGLWNAMLTTAYGLSIALPVLLSAFLFSRLSEKHLRYFQNTLNAKSLEMEGARLDRVYR